MKKLENVTCMVVDLGLFVELAAVLGKSFKKVYYCNPSWVRPFPKLNDAKIGEGIEGIAEVCLSPFEHFDEVDLYVFPDVGHGRMQTYLESVGKAVWGARMAEELEFYRDDCKKLMKKLGMEVGPYKMVTGVEELRKYLKANKDQWVKVDRWRGHFETFEAKDYNLVEPRIDEIEHEIGAWKTELKFTVEANLPDKFEVAVDAYTIDGKLPGSMLYGVEIKDLGYAGKLVSYESVPEALKLFDRKMSDTFAKYKARSFYSPETRVGKDQVPYMIDLCIRAPSPPNELYQVFYKNLAEIIWKGANGEIVSPTPASEWGVEILIHSPWATENWQPIEFPKEFREFVKLRNAVKVNGKLYVMPQVTKLPEVGAIVGYGSSLQDAEKMATEIADSIQGYFLEIPKDSLARAEEEIEKAKEFGLWPEG